MSGSNFTSEKRIMKLIEQLQKQSSTKIKTLYYQLYSIECNDKEEMIQKIIEYYYNADHYKYLFTDAEIAFLESEDQSYSKNKLFKNEIRSLKNQYFVYYDSSTKMYQLFDDLVPVYALYKDLYSKDEREKYGLYRFLVIAYINAYGALSEDDLFTLFHDFYADFHLEELLQLIHGSNMYYGKILYKKFDGFPYYCINDDYFADMALEVIQEVISDEFALIDEDALLAYYHDGYDSTNPSIYELKEKLALTKKEMKEFKDLIIYTYALLQSKNYLQEYILKKLRYSNVSHSYIVEAFQLVDDIYRTYGSWITKGYSPQKVEHIIEENFEQMKEELEEQALMEYLENYQNEEEPIN